MPYAFKVSTQEAWGEKIAMNLKASLTYIVSGLVGSAVRSFKNKFHKDVGVYVYFLWPYRVIIMQ